MKLEFQEDAAAFAGPTQKARIWTEGWVARNLYCPNCGEPKIERFANNRPAADFECLSCREQYEVKSQRNAFGARVVDGAYRTMSERVSSDDNPSFVLLSYNRAALQVTNLMVVPKHFFTTDILEQRKPLSPTARRAGWVGCNILLAKIPQSGRVVIVRDGVMTPKQEVLAQWRKTLFLREETQTARGWLIDVMSCVESIGRDQFSIDEVYAFVPRLEALYPGNQHVREKIRQQLQVLRDGGFLEFLSRGRYRLTR